MTLPPRRGIFYTALDASGYNSKPHPVRTSFKVCSSSYRVMETSRSLLVALLTLCMTTTALSLECYECTNAPGFSGVPTCDSENVTKRTCDSLSDGCMTMSYNLTLLISRSVTTKNCTNSIACNPQFEYNWCKVFEITGLVSNCSVDCCQGDLCNGPSNSTSSSTDGSPTSAVLKPTSSSTDESPNSAVLKLTTNIGAIFSALVLTVFVG